MEQTINPINEFKKGIDVSHFQGNIDWSRVAASGICYGMAKMSEGATYTDERFVTNFKGMKSQGIAAGGYHYFRALSSSAQQQRDNIHARLNDSGFDLTQDRLAIDVEAGGNEGATPDQMADNLYELVNLLKDSLLNGRFPYIYTSPSVWTEKVAWKKYDFSGCPLWIAHWSATEPKVPDTWKDKSWCWWQHSSKGKVEGIVGSVDLDWIKS
ncbi:glycoside hydrolase family 25 protein [Candidatus Regiella endosymbiont of Tuberolachnus salignus]|uniref:glycoside hydrolase family 25 protein n=1 Tax=Candidatus Regiella endosymbiont of Tuberolachnus salignus TaxID=3077956 RepID=UPI0030D2B728